MRKEAKKLSIIEALNRMDNGGALEDLKSAVEEVAEAVDLAGKDGKGKVTLEISFRRVASGQLLITDKVTAKKPEAKKDGTTYFVHPEGGLTVDNPNQGVLSDLAS